ncbi:MAG: glycosyltransferase family 9 protein [bacterium]
MKNIVISGTNFWNPGDDFVRCGVIRILHELFKGDQLNFLFYNFNADFFPLNKFAGISNLAAKGDLDKYRDHIDAIVIAGLSAGNEIKDLYNWVLANKLEDRVYLIGAGYENNYVDTFIRTEPELTIFKNAKVITGRTRKTPDLIHTMNLPYYHVNCPAILSVRNVKKIPPEKKIERIGFSIQLPPDIGISNHSCSEPMYALAIDILTSLMKDYEVEVIAHHKYEYFHFLDFINSHNLSIPVLFSSFFEDLFDMYPRYDCMITTRLHASLFANGHGIPGIILNNTDRHTHCLEQFPHSVWVSDRKQFNEEFNTILSKDLRGIAEESAQFKEALLKRYLDILAKPFGITTKSTIHNEEKKHACMVPVHFFTIVLNGEPFIRHHIEVFNKLPFPWHWHIIEGVADLTHDTSWCLQNGGGITDRIHSEGRSNDGTSEYLDELAKQYSDTITLYRKPRGEFWDGKLEMVNAPLANIHEECLLFQIDTDELWTQDQLKRVYALFAEHPEKTAAFYLCHFFVGEDLVTTTRNSYGNHMNFEWVRTWRFKPGYKWVSHEPPRLCLQDKEGKWHDIAMDNPFVHADTEKEGLLFQHYAYVTKEQLRFKELYYGYRGALETWFSLQAQQEFPVLLRNFFPWVKDNTTVNTAQSQNIYPVAIKNSIGQWRFSICEPKQDEKRGIAWVRTDSIGDNILAASMLPYVRDKYFNAIITVICQDQNAQIYSNSPYIDRIVTFNRLRMIQDAKYRNEIITRLRIIDADLILNSVYSRELITDIVAAYCGSKERVAFKGDLINYTNNLDSKKEYDKIYTALFHSDINHMPELKRHQEFLRYLDIHADSLDPQITTSERDEEFATLFFKENDLDNKYVIALFPGARHFHKEYPHYSAVLKELDDYSLLIMGGKEVYQTGEEILRNYSGRAWNMAGRTTIPQMAALIKKCVLYCGSDSAGAHIACAVNTPNVVILGGGHFGRFMPYSHLTSAVCLPLSCYQCNWQCPYDTVHCIKDINPDTIIEAIRATMKKTSNRPRLFVQNRNNVHESSGNYPQWKWDEEMIKQNNAEIFFLESGKHEEHRIQQIDEDKKNEVMNSLKRSLTQGNYDDALNKIRSFLESAPDDLTIPSIGSNLEKLYKSEEHIEI